MGRVGVCTVGRGRAAEDGCSSSSSGRNLPHNTKLMLQKSEGAGKWGGVEEGGESANRRLGPMPSQLQTMKNLANTATLRHDPFIFALTPIATWLSARPFPMQMQFLCSVTSSKTNFKKFM